MRSEGGKDGIMECRGSNSASGAEGAEKKGKLRQRRSCKNNISAISFCMLKLRQRGACHED